MTEYIKANPKLATQRDDDDRLPIHWAVSYNHLSIVEMLVSRKDFDPDVQVLPLSQMLSIGELLISPFRIQQAGRHS